MELTREELVTMARVGHHPHVVSLLGVSLLFGDPCIVSEYVRGRDVHSRMLGCIDSYIREWGAGTCRGDRCWTHCCCPTAVSFVD